MADGLLNKASIILTPTGYKAGTLYNVAPVVEPYEDFDFARASIASRVNSSGLVEMVGRTLSSELVTNGDFATDSNWNKGSGWSISGGEASCDGSQSSTSNLTQINVFDTPPQSVTDNYKLNFDLVVTLGSITVSSGNLSQSYTSSGSYVLYGSPQVGSGNLNFTANSTFIGSIDNVSVKEIIDTNNIPRISYDSNGDNGHILLEPTSTNLLPYSEDFSQSSWINTYTLTPNSIISPDGSLNAYTITLPSVNGNLRTNVSVSSSTDYIFSFYAKRGTASEMKYRVFDFTNLSDIVSKTSYYSQTDINNWVRIEVPFTTNATTSEVGVYIDSDSQGNGDFYAWGAQLEELPYATSYIPTLTGSTETRATETATGAGSADLINSTEGVLYAEIAMLSEDDKSASNQIAISDGTTNNRILIFTDGSGDVQVLLKDDTEVTKTASLRALDQSQSGVDTAAFNKIAIQYKSGENKLFVNGSEITNSNFNNFVFDYSATTLDNLEFGSGANSNYFRGKVKVLAVFNEALSDSELTQLTT